MCAREAESQSLLGDPKPPLRLWLVEGGVVKEARKRM